MSKPRSRLSGRQGGPTTQRDEIRNRCALSPAPADTYPPPYTPHSVGQADFRVGGDASQLWSNGEAGE